MNVANEKQIDQRWQQIISFYETFDDNRYDLEPQIEIVKQIAKSEYAAELYPFTSHGILCLSTAKDEKSGLNVPMLCVGYSSDQQTFLVEYWSRPLASHDLSSRKCNAADIWRLLESLLIQLKLESSGTTK